jgi:hypothetical protein
MEWTFKENARGHTVGSEPITCMTCRERVPFTRGCCLTCYKQHYMDVAAGEATWADLEARGYVAVAP